MVIVAGLTAYGAVFAINTSVHSFLILAYSDLDRVSMNVGFYYMPNVGARLAVTVLSELIYQGYGYVDYLETAQLTELQVANPVCHLPSLL